MTQVKQIYVARPPEASPHQLLRDAIRSISARPPGRRLVALARRMAAFGPLPRAIEKVLVSLTAPDHLTFQPWPARPRPEAGDTLTVITANLWHDWPRHRQHRQRLEAFARLAERERADVLLLQEVARVRDFQADRWLANRLGMAYLYGQANGDNRLNGFEEGVAILSRYPLEAPSVCYLAPKPLSMVRRLAVGATVKAPGGDFLAVSAHLGHGRKLNTRQLTVLRDWVEGQTGERAAVIGGDFNAGERSPQIREIQSRWLDLYRRANPFGNGDTYRLSWPWGATLMSERLDYLFLRPGRRPWPVQQAWSPVSAGPAHSDHRAVAARLASLN